MLICAIISLRWRSAARYQYKIYVKREQLEQAKAVLAALA